MKHNLLFFICTGLSLTGWGQQQITCQKKVDEFTHDTTVEAEILKIGKHKEGFALGVTFLKARVYTINSNYVLVLRPEFLSIQTIQKGEKAYIKFEDDSVIELVVDETSISNHTSGEAFTQGTDNTIWYNYLSFFLTPQQFMQLESKKVKRVRCSYNDYDPKDDSQASVLMEQIQCIKSKATGKAVAEPKKKKKRVDDTYGN